MTHVRQSPAGTDDAPWSVTAMETLFEDRWRSLHRDHLRFEDGRQSSYVYLQTAPAVFVVPVLAAGEIVLLRQYRHPLHAWFWEIPAGALESDESPLVAARREVAEEIGGTAPEADWHRLGEFPITEAHIRGTGFYYLVRNVTLGAQAPEAHEIYTTHLVSVHEAMALARSSGRAVPPALAHLPPTRFGVFSALGLLLAEPTLTLPGG